MITRVAENRLKQLSKTFKSVSLTGPRQSGKTTLVKTLFTGRPYVSLENPDARRFAVEDPRGFLDTYKTGAILDEIQKAPELFSYLQEVLDNTKQKGLFILTGSNNFLLQQSISQSLAGRTASQVLLPFSIDELKQGNWLKEDDNNLVLKGFYPPVYDQDIPPADWYPNYITTYIEKDVRQLKNIANLRTFERFISIVAGRCGQELNMSSISNETGIDVKTVQSWISILESSYIVYLLKPHHKNFNKVIVKRPKLYFYDTALAASLLGIFSVTQLITHPLRGALFENMVISEFVKYGTHRNMLYNLYYWRDKAGHEIDLIIDNNKNLIPVEIKSAKTITDDFFKNIKYWQKLSGQKRSYLLYAGDQYQKRSNGTEVFNWREFEKILKPLD